MSFYPRLIVGVAVVGEAAEGRVFCAVSFLFFGSSQQLWRKEHEIEHFEERQGDVFYPRLIVGVAVVGEAVEGRVFRAVPFLFWLSTTKTARRSTPYSIL